MCKFWGKEEWYRRADTTYTGILFIFHHETWSPPRRCATLWLWFGREALGNLLRQCYEKVTKFLPLLKNLPKYSLHQNKYLLRSTIILQKHGPKLCPCQPRTRNCSPAANFIPWKDQKKLPGIHGLPSTLVKEQREKAVPITVANTLYYYTFFSLIFRYSAFSFSSFFFHSSIPSPFFLQSSAVSLWFLWTWITASLGSW